MSAMHINSNRMLFVLNLPIIGLYIQIGREYFKWVVIVREIGNWKREASKPIGKLKANNYIKILPSSQRVTVLVVGGGVSGLSTVETLLSNGTDDVLLLEATCRLGGRVQTIRRDGVLVEAGAEWIHGGPRNPVYKIADSLVALGENVPDEQYEWLLVTENGEVRDEHNLISYVGQNSSDDSSDDEEMSNWDLMQELWGETEANGVLAPYYDTAGYGQYFVDRFPEVFGDFANSTEGKALLHALEQIVNGEEGTNDWLDISARDADAYVSYGEDHQWKDGYETLITHILDKIPSSKIQLASPVSEVYWDQNSLDGVLVVTSNGRSFLAQHVVFTTSVAYLKKHHQNIFSPPLPNAYIKALEVNCI
ncbi:unnamed protein product [Meganyctiphanes norvegica]|uniref:Amine oxidase domain-containing protein n=1 Tax=Meganyctiphanes norvegica TaxID=48144 RepID=A0AAV2S334_MEGNR